MKISELKPQPDGKTNFKLSQYNFIPTFSGCYVLTTFNDDILYIGQAVNLRRRFEQHLKNPEKTLPTETGKAISFFFLSWNKNEIGKLERTWLNIYENKHGTLPILNKIHSPIDG